MSLVTFGQQDSVVTEAHRIVSSFNRNVNKMELKENGLIISGIHFNYECLNDKDSSEIHLSEPYRQTSDSITSIIETDSTLSVEFVVYESSHPIMSWVTDVYFENTDTLKIVCYPVEQALSHYPIKSPICIRIDFDKKRNLRLQKILLNAREKWR